MSNATTTNVAARTTNVDDRDMTGAIHSAYLEMGVQQANLARAQGDRLKTYYYQLLLNQAVSRMARLAADYPEDFGNPAQYAQALEDGTFNLAQARRQLFKNEEFYAEIGVFGAEWRFDS